MNTPIIIAGPAVVEYDGVLIESTSDIAVNITDTTEDKEILGRGRVAKRLTGRSAEVKVTPVRWSHFAKLFAILSLARGAMIFGTANKSLKVYGADGCMYEFPRAGIIALPAIGCGVKKNLMAEFTFKCLPDPTKPLSDLSAIYTRSEAPMPALPNLTTADLAATAFGAIFGDLEAEGADKGFFIDLEEGAEISFDVQTTERKLDRLGDAAYDYQLKQVIPTVKIKPTGIARADWDKLVGLTSSPRIGGIVSQPKSLLIRGLYAGDPSFLLNGVVCSDRGLVWSDEAQRHAEITLEAMGTFGANKISVSTAPEDLDVLLDGGNE